MRILWLSNAMWAPSGYGEQTAMFLPRLQALGHEMALAANYGLQGAKFELPDLTIYPAEHEAGNNSLGIFAEHHRADLVIALYDAWVLQPDKWPNHVQVAAWAPVDHKPIPPAVLAVLQHHKVRPIAMSRFGEEMMRRFRLDPLYVPHGVDTELMRPQPEAHDELRDRLGVPPDAFLVGMVAANGGNPAFPRKGFPQAFEAFARFARRHKDAHMYVHAAPARDNWGIDLDVLWRAVCIETGCDIERLRFPPESLWSLGGSRQLVADLYAAFDVLLNPSMGEGFGVPVLEAQACGVPVITSNHSAMPELTHAGWVVDGDNWWDALQKSFAFVPAIGSIVAALEAAYEARDDQAMRAAAVEFAQAYDVDRVTQEYWVPALEALATPREAAPLTVNGNRAQRRAAARHARARV